MVCLSNDLCAGIVLGMISNLGQTASPILTDAPVPISTPLPLPVPNPDHLTSNLPCPSLAFTSPAKKKERG